MLPFVVGKSYRRQEIHAYVGGQEQGGISTPSAYPMILLFAGEQGAQYGYEDGFQPDGAYWYTGQGRIGDMAMTRLNWAIQNHEKLGKALHIFEYVARGEVSYQGQGTYIGYHHAFAPDWNKNIRRVIVFELTVEAGVVGVADLKPDEVSIGANGLWRQPLKRLREAAFAQEDSTAPASERKNKAYVRSEVIKVYVLRRADGYCEGCGQPAPFTTRKGTLYLEPHHLRRRADSGPDHPLWVIALCPNCHKRVHYGIDGHDYNLELMQRVAAIEGLAPTTALLEPATALIVRDEAGNAVAVGVPI